MPKAAHFEVALEWLNEVPSTMVAARRAVRFPYRSLCVMIDRSDPTDFGLGTNVATEEDRRVSEMVRKPTSTAIGEGEERTTFPRRPRRTC